MIERGGRVINKLSLLFLHNFHDRLTLIILQCILLSERIARNENGLLDVFRQSKVFSKIWSTPLFQCIYRSRICDYTSGNYFRTNSKNILRLYVKRPSIFFNEAMINWEYLLHNLKSFYNQNKGVFLFLFFPF